MNAASPDGGRDRDRDATRGDRGTGERNSRAVGPPGDGDGGEVPRHRVRPYTESVVIMTTVRVVAPFVLTFGLFLMLHGADSPGGGFQGGVVVAATVVMLAFAFGVGPTRRWLDRRAVTAVTVGGIGFFGAIAVGSLAYDGALLQYDVYPVDHAAKIGIELVELGIGATVTGAVVGLFFVTAAGIEGLGSREDEER